MYVDKGYDFDIVTSAKNLISKLRKSNKWILIRYAKNKNDQIINNKKWESRKVLTASFFYNKKL